MASSVRSDSKEVRTSYSAEEKKPASAGRGSGKGAPEARKGMTRLPDLDMVRILTRDPLSFQPYNVEALRRLVREVRPGASEEALRLVTDAFNEEMKEQFGAFQDWMFEQFEKGYVEVPDEFVEETEEARRRTSTCICRRGTSPPSSRPMAPRRSCLRSRGSGRLLLDPVEYGSLSLISGAPPPLTTDPCNRGSSP